MTKSLTAIRAAITPFGNGIYSNREICDSQRLYIALTLKPFIDQILCREQGILFPLFQIKYLTYTFMTVGQQELNSNEVVGALPYSEYASYTNRLVEAMRIQAGIDPAVMKEIVVRLRINEANEDGTFAGNDVYFNGMNGSEVIDESNGVGFVPTRILPPLTKTFPDLEGKMPFSFRELKDAFDPRTTSRTASTANEGHLKTRVKPFLDDLNELGEKSADFITYYVLCSLEKFYRDKITREPGNGMQIGSLRIKAEEYEKGITGESGGIRLGDKSPSGVEKRLRQLFLDGDDSENYSGIKTLPYLFVLGRLERTTKLIASLSERFPAAERNPIFEAMHAYLFLKDAARPGVLSGVRKTMVALMKEGKYEDAKQVGVAYNLNIEEERKNSKQKSRR